MAVSDAKKRRLPPKVAAMQAKKRRKLEDEKQSGGASVKKAKTAPLARKVRLDELKWNDVEMPDKLDDYEGFFGLEEIDDVEVVKDASGKMSFTSRGVAKNGNDKTATSGDPDEEEILALASDLSDGGDDFEGLSDHDDEVHNPPPKSIIKVSNMKTQANGKTKATLPKEPKKSKSTEAGKKSAFAVIQNDDMDENAADISAWRSLNLSPDTLAGLSKLKFASPTPIQQAAIPEIMSGSDVIGKASTGSGKTLAFGIPIFEAYLDQKLERATARQKETLAPLAIIISPTRELAHQISQHLTTLSNGLPNERPYIATLTGGLSVHKQQRQLKNADIIIGTPGRLWEVISGGKDLIERMKQVQFLVLDEADRLLSQGHFQELEELLNALDRTVSNDEADENSPEEKSIGSTRQTLIFSATFQKDLQHKLARKQKLSTQVLDKKESMEYLMQRLNFRSKPRFLDVDPVRQMAANLKEGIVECHGQEKDLYLYALHLLHPTARTLVFVNSISSVRRIVPFLQNLSLSALPLHSQMPQKARLRSVERFTASSASILVATDVAARGLDIPAIDLVVHYHLPRASDAYIHRSGRTARAGASGSSILLCAPDEVVGVRRLVAKVHSRAPLRSLDLDRRVVQRLRPRAQLAKRIADVDAAKEKKRGRDDVFRRAAEDLGVEYDSEELEQGATGRQGRGAGRREKERRDRGIGQEQVRDLRGQLRALLAQRVNVGVSERYPTSGTIDIDELLREEDGAKTGEFLGAVRELDMDD
ncbi:hypothetical protein ANO11243_077820 [Dothideomycetidae sp. 11243]|nr:hypothetical protein ANO11243_077820 [fungal sp. No.11243]